MAHLNSKKPVPDIDNGDIGVIEISEPKAGGSRGKRGAQAGGKGVGSENKRKGRGGKERSKARKEARHCRCNQGWVAAQKINNGRKNVIKVIVQRVYSFIELFQN